MSEHLEQPEPGGSHPGGGDQSAPDIVELLTTDHARIQRLIDEGDRDGVVGELSSHLVAEDQLVYPDVRRFLAIDELLDAHLDSDRLLEEALVDLDKHRTDDLSDVASRFAGHVLSLEEVVFPRMREGIEAERLVHLGEGLGEVVRTAPRHPHPHLPDEGFLEVVGDALAAEVESLRDRRHVHDDD